MTIKLAKSCGYEWPKGTVLDEAHEKSFRATFPTGINDAGEKVWEEVAPPKFFCSKCGHSFTGNDPEHVRSAKELHERNCTTSKDRITSKDMADVRWDVMTNLHNSAPPTDSRFCPHSNPKGLCVECEDGEPMKIHQMDYIAYGSLCGIPGATLRHEYEKAMANGTLPDPRTVTPPHLKCLDCLKISHQKALNELEEAKRAQVESGHGVGEIIAHKTITAVYLLDEDLLARDE